MSIGNLKTEGNKGNNFPYQLRNLQLLADVIATGAVSNALLTQILTAIQDGSDYEAMLVVDNAGVTWLEVKVWNPSTGTFDPPVYYAPGSNTPGSPALPVTYINPNTYLATIASNTTGLATEVTLSTRLADATFTSRINTLGQKTMAASTPVVLASNQSTIPTYPFPTTMVSGATGAITNTSATTIIAAQAGAVTYVTQILVTNAHATVGTVVRIIDGATTNVLYTGYAAPAGGGFSISFPTPLRMPSSNSALQIICVTTGSEVYASACGFSI